MTIQRLEFSEGAEVQPAPAGRGSLLCLGDSITQGMDAPHTSSTYPALLARAMKFDLFNQGIGRYFFDSDSAHSLVAIGRKGDIAGSAGIRFRIRAGEPNGVSTLAGTNVEGFTD